MAFKTDRGNAIVFDFQIDRNLVAAQRVMPMREMAGPSQRTEISRVTTVIKNDVLIEFP